MRYLISIFSILIILSTSCENELTVSPTYDSHFVKVFGLQGNQEGRDMTRATDGFVLMGRTDSESLGKQIYVVKTDELGNELWNMTYGSQFDEDPATVNVSPTGQILISSTLYYVDGTSDMLFYLLNADGSVADSTLIGDPGFSEVAADAVFLNQSSEHLLLGTTDDTQGLDDQPETAVVLYKTLASTLDLDNLFICRFGQGVSNNAVGVVEGSGNFIVLSTSNAEALGGNFPDGNNLLVTRVDPFGNNGEGTPFGTDDEETASKIYGNLDGTFTVSGTTSNGASSTVFIEKFTNTTNFPSSLTQPIIVPKSNIQTSDILNIGLGYIILGTETAGVNDTNVYLAFVENDTGSIRWETRFGGVELDSGESGLFRDSDGGFVFLATIDMESQNKMALIKVNDSGLLGP